jgi:hypothetical protein
MRAMVASAEWESQINDATRLADNREFRRANVFVVR